MSVAGSVTIVPSVHFSPAHRRRVREAIRNYDPDIVAVELDASRYERLWEHEAGTVDLPPPAAATYAVFRAIQQTVVRLAGLDPETTDMETAIETAADRETPVALIDEPMGETIQALGDAVGLETVPNVVMRAQQLGPELQARNLELLSTPFSEITHGEDVQPAIDQLRALLPEVATVLIDRRDRAMAERLHALRISDHEVVAVVGAGHHLGIEGHLKRLAAGEDATCEDVPIRRPASDVTQIPIE